MCPLQGKKINVRHGVSQAASKYCQLANTFSHLGYYLRCPDHHTTDCNQSVNVYKNKINTTKEKYLLQNSEQNAGHKLNEPFILQ